MKKTLVTSFVVVIALAAAASCAGCTSPTTPSPSPGSTATSKATVLGAGITVVQGQNFTIQLRSNPSTGYHWEPTYDSSYINFISRAYIASSLPMPGAPGADVFTFLGTQQGTSIITFDYKSPSNQTARSVNYTVTCTSSNVTQGNAALVSKGQNFTIQLQSNPSTGYHWEPTYNSAYIMLVNRAFASGTSANPLLVGASGTDTFTFQGTREGTSVITFNNISPINETANSLSYTVLITS
jgi:predicted secreted protein